MPSDRTFQEQLWNKDNLFNLEIWHHKKWFAKENNPIKKPEMQGVVTRDIGKYGVKSKHQYTILMRVINIYFQDFFFKKP